MGKIPLQNWLLRFQTWSLGNFSFKNVIIRMVNRNRKDEFMLGTIIFWLFLYTIITLICFGVLDWYREISVNSRSNKTLSDKGILCLTYFWPIFLIYVLLKFSMKSHEYFIAIYERFIENHLVEKKPSRKLLTFYKPKFKVINGGRK